MSFLYALVPSLGWSLNSPSLGLNTLTIAFLPSFFIRFMAASWAALLLMRPSLGSCMRSFFMRPPAVLSAVPWKTSAREPIIFTLCFENFLDVQD
ncbi:hypothetical protein MpV1_137c [Micromonas sp. RCC1109 virus MpV1]|uniref:hypothetical protein n=1 Tax=Micromonas sp. RCC1109 virus MpV1 TaxID=880161 RepID=UPI0001EF4502|nr:hypothetical protein MpV1_137c [Micromonas sp. RCC1109 virus MpV1]ADQ91060.1 hypothetical protein MpV1_137c [Micromonas sp. RCC1109 virus MpV1]